MNKADADLQAENNRLRAFIAAIHCRLQYGPKFTEATRLAIIDDCLKEIPKLEAIGLGKNQ